MSGWATAILVVVVGVLAFMLGRRPRSTSLADQASTRALLDAVNEKAKKRSAEIEAKTKERIRDIEAAEGEEVRRLAGDHDARLRLLRDRLRPGRRS